VGSCLARWISHRAEIGPTGKQHGQRAGNRVAKSFGFHSRQKVFHNRSFLCREFNLIGF
jgi:hypothetical protein